MKKVIAAASLFAGLLHSQASAARNGSFSSLSM
jgi:hypothetical protein